MKFKHYARPVSPSATNTNFEALIIEIAVGVICGIYAYMGYGVQVGQMFYPCLLVSVICFLLVSHTIYGMVRDKLEAKRQIEEDKSGE